MGSSPANRLPSSHRTQDGCWNCRFVFKMVDYDDPPFFFCERDSGHRPPCGSVLMRDDFEDLCKDMDASYAWSSGREVNPYDICDHHERKPNGE